MHSADNYSLVRTNRFTNAIVIADRSIGSDGIQLYTELINGVNVPLTTFDYSFAQMTNTHYSTWKQIFCSQLIWQLALRWYLLAIRIPCTSYHIIRYISVSWYYTPIMFYLTFQGCFLISLKHVWNTKH